MEGTVIAVSKSETHSFSKYNQESIELIVGWGIEGDAHAGKTVQHLYLKRTEPDRLNNREVHLISMELLEELREQGFDLTPGLCGENINTRGIPLLDLPEGTLLYIGDEVCIELTGLRDPCGQLNGIQEGLKSAMLDEDEDGNTIYKCGVHSQIKVGGIVRPNDAVRVELPPEPHKPMHTI